MRSQSKRVLLIGSILWFSGCDAVTRSGAEGTPDVHSCDCADPSPDAGSNPVDLEEEPTSEPAACIETTPQQIKFGGKKVGDMATLPLEIRSCGEADLEIRSIGLAPDSHPAYGLDLGALAHAPTEDDPVTVPPGESVAILVTYVPECLEPLDESGNPPPVVGEIAIHSNATPEKKLVEVGGFGALTLCPIPVITCTEGDQVAPWTEIHLSGAESYVDLWVST